MKKFLVAGIALVALASCNQTQVTEKTLLIAPQLYTVPTVTSSNLKPQLSPLPPCQTDCLKVSEPNIQGFYTLDKTKIQGFTFAPNFNYKLKVRVTTVSNSFAITYELLEQLEKTPAQQGAL